MSDLFLEFPSKKREQDAKMYLQEFYEDNSEINGMGGLNEQEDYDKWLKLMQDYREGSNLPEDYVSASQYFLIREEDDRIIGMANIRHGLNDFLINTGYGHIGYSIRPSERRKGYATKLLALALRKCKQLNIDKVHVGCDEKNIGSKKTIEKNGGRLFRKTKNDGVPYLEFVIE